MKYDYTTARSLLIITSVVMFTQLITEVVGTRKPEFWWVFPACAAVWGISVGYAFLLIILNARTRTKQDK